MEISSLRIVSTAVASFRPAWRESVPLRSPTGIRLGLEMAACQVVNSPVFTGVHAAWTWDKIGPCYFVLDFCSFWPMLPVEDEMRVTRRLSVPTGDICIGEGSRGPLEFLSLGDYGAHVNLNQHKKVEHGTLLPLSEKWVITISTQYGCSMGCAFCDVPKVGPGRNATLNDLQGQVVAGLHLHPEIATTKRLNVHFARMGEPTWNPNVLDCAKWLHEHVNPEYRVHPVVSTMMPRRNEWLKTFIHTWMRIKNRLYNGEAGLQISVNSTDETERATMFNGNALDLLDISRLMEGVVPYGRKITLNFAVAGYTIDPDTLLRFFSPEHYIVKLTPMHKTNTALENGIETTGDYTESFPYEHHEEALKSAGYEVLTFIASKEEDLGRITCGNAILSGTLPLVNYVEHKIALTS